MWARWRVNQCSRPSKCVQVGSVYLQVVGFLLVLILVATIQETSLVSSEPIPSRIFTWLPLHQSVQELLLSDPFVRVPIWGLAERETWGKPPFCRVLPFRDTPNMDLGVPFGCPDQPQKGYRASKRFVYAYINSPNCSFQNAALFGFGIH